MSTATLRWIIAACCKAERTFMYQRKDGTWCDTLPRKGDTPKFFYGKSPADVKKKMKAWNEEQEKGIFFKEAAEKWLSSQEKEVRQSTYYNYKAPYRRIIETFGKMRVSDITPNMVQNYINSVAAKGYSKGRVELYLGIMRGAFREAITMPHASIQFNPCDSVRVPASCKNHVRDLPPREAVEIVKRNVGEDFGLFPYLLIYSGLRKGEALALTDKDFSKSVIHVTKALKFIGGQTIIGEPKSEAGVRDVVLLKPLANVLPKWKGYLFSEDGGKSPLSASQFVKLWDRYALDVGLAHEERIEKHRADGRAYHVMKVVHHICPHQLRHEFATICFDAGLDPLDTAEMIGHADDSTTKQIYTHIKDSRRVKTYTKLQDYVRDFY